MGGTDNDLKTAMLQPHSQDSITSDAKRTGTLWTAVAHIITGVIGSGVLSLAWGVAQLGWIAGPLSMLLLASVTLLSNYLLCDCYRSPDPEYGPRRNPSYLDAVRTNLGEKMAWACGICVYVSLYGIGIAYTITAATSMRAIQESNCYHSKGHAADCQIGDSYYMLMFGIVEIFMSQIPNMHEIEWVSVVAAIMSFTYAFIGLGLGVATVIGNGVVKGSITGAPASTEMEKVWLVAQGIGNVTFAFPYSLILIEIQDTLKSPPPETTTMKKAATMAMGVTTLFYLLCGGFGYAAFGVDTPGNLLTGFGFYEPYWLVDIANAAIIIHLVGGYQVYTQPFFAAVDRWFTDRYPESNFVNSQHRLKIPLLPSFKLNLFRLCFRTVYVVTATVLAMLFPYFNEVLGVIGAVIFWPLTIYFPVEMYFVQRNIQPWSNQWKALKAFVFIGLIVNIFSLCGSIEGILAAKLS